MTQIEICLTDLASAVAAAAGGAARVELCDNLAEGGTTPSLGMITAVSHTLTIPTHVIIRPRGGDFCYSAVERDIMSHDIVAAKSAGAAGVVLGLLLPNGDIDAAETERLIALARPMKVTFHRAFDMCRDPLAAFDTLQALGVDFLLTSGQAETAVSGATLIRELVVRGKNGRLRVMAGGGVNASNAAQLVGATGVADLHAGSAVTDWVESQMAYRNPQVAMGNSSQSEYARRQVTAKRVAALVAAAQKL
ncbi:MAG: copper homeostasis protein CutC [Anaerolineales bacterium]|nr:copper homeostasis protein CutC [Anaerolineales bacterium]